MLVKLLLAAVALLLVMFLVLVWLVAMLAKISLLWPAAVTVFFVMVGLTIFVARSWKAHKGARGLEQGLREQAQAQAKHVRPDLEPELQEMQQEFDRAMGALKNSPHGRRNGSNALYFLPWYAIIGPSGAGKTTALRHSGLKFPAVKGARDIKVRGLGGTRNCDWWLTNQAVLLDTAGRWSTQEEDHDEWLGFLGLLKKYRPRKPLNGVIAAISVGDVVNASEDEVQALARRMRERVDEVIGQLRVSLPVYLLFTKCDLLEGFVETFGELPAGDREQVWGFTAGLTGEADSGGAYFENEFETLTQRLEQISLARIGIERRIEARQLIYAFPQQVMAMRHNLRSFVNAMFEGNVYQETPPLRGVYFTSGTQEGRPFSLLLNRLAEALGVGDRLSTEAPALDQKSYFLRDVFMKVIFEDQDLASASQKELRRQRFQRIALTAALAVVAISVGVVPSYAFSRNRSQLVQTSSLVDFWEGPGRANHTNQNRLDGLRKVLADLSDYEVHAPSFISTFGMYQGDKVHPSLRRYTAGLLRRELVQPLVARDVQSMAEFGFKYESAPRAMPNATEHGTYYDLLKLHLLLSGPKPSGEPGLDEKYGPWVATHFAKRWGGLLEAGEKDAAELGALARRYVEYAGQYPELSLARDASAVRRTRAALTRLPLARHALERIVARAAQEDYDVTLAKLIGSVNGITARSGVRGAFTRRGWENVVRDELTPDAIAHAGELWVLGLADRRDTQRQTDAQLQELTSLYFQTYAEEWRTFLRGVRVSRPSSNPEALTLLNELLRGEPTPIELLMHKVHYNVQLKPKPTEAVVAGAGDSLKDALKDKVGRLLGVDGEDTRGRAARRVRAAIAEGEGQRVTAAQVAAMFQGFTGFAVPVDTGEEGRPPPSPAYGAYEEQLSSVREALQQHGDSAQDGEQLMARLQSAQLRVHTLVEGREPIWRSVFEAILEPPFESATANSNRNLADSAGRRWCSEVAQPFERALAGRYPFNRRGLDLPLENFSAFYKPNTGTVWRFAQNALGNVVVLDGDEYEFGRAMGRNPSAVYSSALPQFLTRSRDISTVFFPPGSDRPKVEFEVRIHPAPGVATTTFSLGGQTIAYHNGPEKWVALSWPGQDPEAGAGFVARGANGMQERAKQEGAWGLYRLLEAGTLTRPSNQIFTVAWQLRTHDVTLKIDFRPVRGESPFLGVPGRSSEPQLMQPLRDKGVLAPKQITHSAQSCNI